MLGTLSAEAPPLEHARRLDHPKSVWFTSEGMTKLNLGLAALLGGALFWACSTGEGGMLPGGGQGGGVSTTNVFSGGTTGTTQPGVGATGNVSINPTGTTTTAADAGFRRPKVCDATGQNCKCINLASLGERASKSYGVGNDGQPSSTTAFETWLAEKSNATVTFELAYKPLTPEYLATLDVIILQDLRTWNLTASDIQNLSDWVNQGGGLISLNGYMNNDDAEVTATNRVIAFTGMSYLGGGTSGSVPDGNCAANSQLLCPMIHPGGNCCYCWNNTLPVTDWTASHPIAKDIRGVGAVMGRQVNPGDGTVVATYSGKPVAATKEIGTGKAFVWCDEWVTYTSSWSGGQIPADAATKTAEQLTYEQCYDSTLGKWRTAEVALQSMQFWYNAIHYVSPQTECDFVINEPPDRIILL